MAKGSYHGVNCALIGPVSYLLLSVVYEEWMCDDRSVTFFARVDCSPPVLLAESVLTKLCSQWVGHLNRCHTCFSMILVQRLFKHGSHPENELQV